MPMGGWLCHTKIVARDRVWRGKEQRKEGGTDVSQAVWQVVASLIVVVPKTCLVIKTKPGLTVAVAWGREQ